MRANKGHGVDFLTQPISWNVADTRWVGTVVRSKQGCIAQMVSLDLAPVAHVQPMQQMTMFGLAMINTL
jgi:hypothetical protein